jgi:hypothetical protein
MSFEIVLYERLSIGGYHTTSNGEYQTRYFIILTQLPLSIPLQDKSVRLSYANTLPHLCITVSCTWWYLG